MEKWEPLNMELRSWAIAQVLRLEQTSSSAIRAILRMFNEKSKTLGNQSSALPFRSKIDLLLDLEEIDKNEYAQLIKLMEVRNQFAHNPKAISFEILDRINPDINKFLIRFDTIPSTESATRENRLKTAFSELFKVTAGKLLLIEIEYGNGIQKEMRKHLNDKIVEGMDQIWENAMKRNKEGKITSPTLFFMQGNENEIEDFYMAFKIAMGEFTIAEMDKIKGDKLNTVFKQKETIEETLTRKKKHK